VSARPRTIDKAVALTKAAPVATKRSSCRSWQLSVRISN